MKACISIHGTKVPVHYEASVAFPMPPTMTIAGTVALGLTSVQFKHWVKVLDPGLTVHEIFLQAIDIFQAPGKVPRCVFVKFAARISRTDGSTNLIFVLLRGMSVAALVLLECEGEDFVLLTSQAREAVGMFPLLEIPAGSMESPVGFSSKIIEELGEETGLHFEQEEIIDVMALINPEHDGLFYLSPGTVDEQMKFFVARRHVTRKELDEITARVCGLAEEGEEIRLSVASLHHVRRTIRDGKTLIAIERYVFAKEQGLL